MPSTAAQDARIVDPDATYQVVTTILVTDDLGHRTEQVVDREWVTGGEWAALCGQPLTAGDTGSEPGQAYRLDLTDPADAEGTPLRSYETTAVTQP